MRTPISLRHEFLKRWLKGLQMYSTRKKEMSILDRKKAIKLSADVAMASTRASKTFWGQFVISKSSKDSNEKFIVEHILGSDNSDQIILKKNDSSMGLKLCSNNSKRIRSKKILRKSCRASRRFKKGGKNVVEANSIARKLVKKRKQVLKSLVPGGELMDEVCLIRETLDYIVSLRVQVDVMRHLTNATMQHKQVQE